MRSIKYENYYFSPSLFLSNLNLCPEILKKKRNWDQETRNNPIDKHKDSNESDVDAPSVRNAKVGPY